MTQSSSRTFVGFGFGAIQAGLFLYEAQRSGNFSRLVVAEVLPDVVAALREAGGVYALNIAQPDAIVQVEIGPIAIENPGEKADRERLVAAIADASEIATAIPSVSFYASSGPGSLHRILAEGLRRKVRAGGPRAVIYAAENHNHAAELLEEAVFSVIPAGEQPAVRARVRFLNTVIGKMSGIKTDAAEIDALGLRPITAGATRAFLVEAFNRIFISRIDFPPDPSTGPYRRGIEVFIEKADLLPFEEAKLYGHNAVHALAAYLGGLLGVEFIADLRAKPGVMAFLRDAFLLESGAALILKYQGVDELFTDDGYRRYAEDLLARMTNPHLRDTVERVGRDPERKLGWEDRLVGTMRLALSEGVEPRRFATGVAAVLASLAPEVLDAPEQGIARLREIWQPAQPQEDEQEQVVARVRQALERLARWRATGAEGALLN